MMTFQVSLALQDKVFYDILAPVVQWLVNFLQLSRTQFTGLRQLPRITDCFYDDDYDYNQWVMWMC